MPAVVEKELQILRDDNNNGKDSDAKEGIDE